MNERMKMAFKNATSQLVRMSNRQRNVLRWSANESRSHVLMKFEICDYIKKQGEEFICEAIFEGNKGRCDVLWLDRGYCIEVFESEKEHSLLLKSEKYPLPLIIVKANQKFHETLIL